MGPPPLTATAEAGATEAGATAAGAAEGFGGGPGAAPPSGHQRWPRLTRRRLAREAMLLVGLFALYKFVRLLVRDQQGEALANAGGVIELEQRLGLFLEPQLQELAAQSSALIRAMNGYYLAAHFTVTVGALVALLVWHPVAYQTFRNRLLAMSGIALVVHAAYPLAPPRLLPGFVDTAAHLGPRSYGDGAIFDGLANQFAAMPSLHFGWALLVAITVVRVTRSAWRWLAVAHPGVTLTSILVTANHFWLDAAVAALILAVVMAAEALVRRHRQRCAGPHRAGWGPSPGPDPSCTSGPGPDGVRDVRGGPGPADARRVGVSHHGP